MIENRRRLRKSLVLSVASPSYWNPRRLARDQLLGRVSQISAAWCCYIHRQPVDIRPDNVLFDRPPMTCGAIRDCFIHVFLRVQYWPIVQYL
jgi:hypothetical protein